VIANFSLPEACILKKSFFIATIALIAVSTSHFAWAKCVKLVIAGRDGDYGNPMQVALDAYKALHPEVSFELLRLSGDDIYQKTVIACPGLGCAGHHCGERARNSMTWIPPSTFSKVQTSS
jgi:hypothetical protein